MSDRPATRRIVFALDASEGSQYALKWGLLNHVRPTDMVILLSIGDGADAIIRDAEGVVEQHTDAIGGKPQIARAALKGRDPRDAITDHCRDIHADALIMGSRGLSAVKRALLGSVSDYCARQVTDCAVIIVK